MKKKEIVHVIVLRFRLLYGLILLRLIVPDFLYIRLEILHRPKYVQLPNDCQKFYLEK